MTLCLVILQWFMKVKIVSWNVNGIRAVERKKALQKFLGEASPDIFCIQETKARPDQLSDYLVDNPDYYSEYHAAEKAGYSGVSIWVKKSLVKERPAFQAGMPGFDDTEGRILHVALGDYIIFGNYFPNGGKSDKAYEDKLVFFTDFQKYINQLRKSGKKVIFTGDINIAHNEIDLALPKENEKNTGFTRLERDW